MARQTNKGKTSRKIPAPKPKSNEDQTAEKPQESKSKDDDQMVGSSEESKPKGDDRTVESTQESKSNGSQTSESPQEEPAGMPIFYSQPEVLDPTRHEGLELKPMENYGFASSVNAIPITAAEFPMASRDYPIVFTGGKKHNAVAIVGLRKEENLMVEKLGNWLPGAYVPAYVRRYPFIFLRNNDSNQYALCIDRACKQLGEGKNNPLFEGTEMGELTKKALEFCKTFQQQHLATERVVNVLTEHELLMPNQGQFTLPDGQSLALAGFMTVDEKKFNELSDEDFLKIRKSGALPAIYCHLVSMGAWQKLAERFASTKSDAGTKSDAK